MIGPVDENAPLANHADLLMQALKRVSGGAENGHFLLDQNQPDLQKIMSMSVGSHNDGIKKMIS
jgi:hypothetical protein